MAFTDLKMVFFGTKLLQSFKSISSIFGVLRAGSGEDTMIAFGEK
jgi:hypothetical protein